MLQCTIATALPVGVVTMSTSGYQPFSGRSRTAIAKTDVPAETLPVRAATLFVATMPVPASPSGGASGIPAFSAPVGSRMRAPSSVSAPASAPAGRTSGSRSSSFHGRPRGARSAS